MKNTNILLIFIILAIIIGVLWIGSYNYGDTSKNDNIHHHHQHNLGPGGELQPIHTHVITK